MAKKFGKFLLGTALIGGAAAAAYMYLQKKSVVSANPESIDEDYDDFSEDAEESSSRNYVSLTKDTETNGAEECTVEEPAAEACVAEEPVFTEVTSEENVPVPEKPAEPDTVEEFFDEEKSEE